LECLQDPLSGLWTLKRIEEPGWNTGVSGTTEDFVVVGANRSLVRTLDRV